MRQLDYSSVNRNWDRVTPSMLGPDIMHGFKFPAGAGWFRFIPNRNTSSTFAHGELNY